MAAKRSAKPISTRPNASDDARPMNENVRTRIRRSRSTSPSEIPGQKESGTPTSDRSSTSRQRPGNHGSMPTEAIQDGRAIAERFMKRRSSGGSTFADSVRSSDEVWKAMERLFRPLPVKEGIAFLGRTYTCLETERQRQYEEAFTDPLQSVCTYAMFSLENAEANQLLIRTMIVYQLLDACGGAPDYTFGELLLHLQALHVERARRMARAILGFFPSYGIERWIDVYGSRKQAEMSKFAGWSPFEWRQLEAWIESLEADYHQRLLQEVEAGGLEARNAETGVGKSPRRGGVSSRGRTGRSGPIRVGSTDVDVIRILEAMKQEGIIAHDTTGPQIVAAFTWKGEFNDKPENYYAARKNLENPPSNRVVAFIARLLENAGDDIKQEVITLCRPR